MNRENDVVCLSHLRWSFVFQRPNHLMTHCAQTRRVFFWEEPIFDVEPGHPSHVVEHETIPNLRVLTPHLSRDGSPERIASEQRRLLTGTLSRCGVVEPVLWFYTPMALDFAGDIPASAVVYDCMDELSAFHGAPPALRQREADLFSRADVVFTGGYSLYESKRAQHGNVHCFPSSVDRDHFARARQSRAGDPADQRVLAHPRIGYFGVIDERIDLALLARVADSHPEWQIVMIGPVVKIDPSTLPRRANIAYLGQKSYDELPEYLAGWDVAIMPFALNDATRFISPTKTLEYLAAGKPVVSTPIRDVVRPYGDAGIVRIGNEQTFTQEIERALEEPFEDRLRAADDFVAGTSWSQTWEKMSSLVDLDPVRARERRVDETLDASSEASCTTI